MWRNNPRINSLFMRSVNWKQVVMSGNDLFAFDESSRPVAPGEESISKVLEFSTDVRQCFNHRVPQVRRGKDSLFIAEMVSHINEKSGGMLYFKWEKGIGINLTVVRRILRVGSRCMAFIFCTLVASIIYYLKLAIFWNSFHGLVLLTNFLIQCIHSSP